MKMTHADMLRVVTLTREMFFVNGKRVSRVAWDATDAATLAKTAFYTRRVNNAWHHRHIAVLPAFDAG